jgi:hypothetical protein
MQSGRYTGVARSSACFSASSRDLAEIEFTTITAQNHYASRTRASQVVSRVWRKTLFPEQSTTCGALDRRHSSPSEAYHHHDGKTIWTEPVVSWHEAYLLGYLNHTVLLQIIATSPIPRSIIVLTDDPREKRRHKANSISTPMKKILSLSIYYKYPI